MRLFARGSTSTVREVIDQGFLAGPGEELILSGLGEGSTEEIKVESVQPTQGVIEFSIKPPPHPTAVLPESLPFLISIDCDVADLGSEVTGNDDHPNTGVFWLDADTANKFHHALRVWCDGDEVPLELVGR